MTPQTGAGVSSPTRPLVGLTYGGTGGNIASIADGFGRQWSFTVSSGQLTGAARLLGRRHGDRDHRFRGVSSWDRGGIAACS